MVIIWKYAVMKKMASKNSSVPNYAMKFRNAVINVREIVIIALAQHCIRLAKNNVIKFLFVSIGKLLLFLFL